MATDRDQPPISGSPSDKRAEANTFSYEKKPDSGLRADPTARNSAAPEERSGVFKTPPFSRRNSGTSDRQDNVDLSWRDEDFARIAATAETSRPSSPERKEPTIPRPAAPRPKASSKAEPEIAPNAVAPSEAEAQRAPIETTPQSTLNSARAREIASPRSEDASPRSEDAETGTYPTPRDTPQPAVAPAPTARGTLGPETVTPDLMARLAARSEPFASSAQTHQRVEPSFHAQDKSSGPVGPSPVEESAFHTNRANRENNEHRAARNTPDPAFSTESLEPRGETFDQSDPYPAYRPHEVEAPPPISGAWRAQDERDVRDSHFDSPRFGPAVSPNGRRASRSDFGEPAYMPPAERRSSPIIWTLVGLLLAGGGYAVAHQFNFKIPELTATKTTQTADITPAPAPEPALVPQVPPAAPLQATNPAALIPSPPPPEQAAATPAPAAAPASTPTPPTPAPAIAAQPNTAPAPDATAPINVPKLVAKAPKPTSEPASSDEETWRRANANNEGRTYTQREARRVPVELAPGPQMLKVPQSAAVTNQLITDAQRELNRLGYPDVRRDGQLDLATRRAVRAFQLQSGLTPSGEIDTRTLDALRRTSQVGMRLQPGPATYN